VSEPSNLYVAGTVNLFTAEYYALVRAHLAPGGVFCQWMHYYGGSLDDCRTVARTVRAVFPHAALWIHSGGDIFLLAADRPLPVDLAAIRRRLADPRVAADLRRIGYATAEQLAAHLLMGDEDLARFAGAGPVCTDDRPVLEFSAPRTRDTPRLTDLNRAALYAWHPLAPLPLTAPRAADRMALGRTALEEQELYRALAEFDAALTLAPGLAAAWWQKARLQHWLLDDAGALATVSAGLARIPGDPPLLALRREIRSAPPPRTDPPKLN